MDIIKVGELDFSGSKTTVEVEEGRNFRRITIARYRKMMGVVVDVRRRGSLEGYEKMGEVHIYDFNLFVELMERALEAIRRIGEVGFDEAKVEVEES